MIDTFETYAVETSEVRADLSPRQDASSHRLRDCFRLLRQVLRFGLVGGLNTLVDLLILNSLLLLFPTTSALMLLAYNSLAYSLGAVNSFLLNKYWTFGYRQKTTRRELARFTLTTLCGIAWSTIILWLASNVLRPFLVNPTVWANASKVVAIAGTALISYLGMRLWVFVSNVPRKQARFHATVSAETLEATTQAQPAPLIEPSQGDHYIYGRGLPPALALGSVMLISLFMNFYQLGQNGFGNLYYAAGVRSMLDNLHNFFFVSYDPGGFVTLDKPPLGFWLQVVSAKIFGFTPFSIFLPQALAGVLSVLLLYHLVRRHFGVVAALLAALALAISPISVVTNRNNTIDSTLVLVMLLGAWAVLRAAETGKLRWLLLCAVFVGLGFNIKMLEAYLVVPAYGLLYLLAAPRRVWVRIVQLALAALLMLTISLSWAVAVDLTPAASRPYVGSSQDNSEISLALGYNGVQRLLGVFGFGGRTSGNTPRLSPPAGTGEGTVTGDFPRPGAGDFGQPPQSLGSGGGGGMFNTGNPGLLRLFNEPLGGQIVWLLPMALLGMLALAWQRRPRFREDRAQQSLILWGVWLLTMAVFFSVAGFFHQYYLSTLAPAICALFGIGVVVMWRDYRRSGWRGWLLPLALLLTALEQIHIIVSNPSWGTWLIPLIAIPCTLAAVILFAARLIPRLRLGARVLVPALCVSLLALLLTSAVWSAIPVLANQSASLPVAGPGGQSFSGMRGSSTVDTALIRYLEAHRGGAKYLVAVASSNQANAIILATNQPVMALGGFSGSDPILTTAQLAALVKNGAVRFFLLNGSGGGPGGGQSALTTWITQHSTAVPSSQWQSSSSNGSGGSEQLYKITSVS